MGQHNNITNRSATSKNRTTATPTAKREPQYPIVFPACAVAPWIHPTAAWYLWQGPICGPSPGYPPFGLSEAKLVEFNSLFLGSYSPISVPERPVCPSFAQDWMAPKFEPSAPDGCQVVVGPNPWQGRTAWPYRCLNLYSIFKYPEVCVIKKRNICIPT